MVENMILSVQKPLRLFNSDVRLDPPAALAELDPRRVDTLIVQPGPNGIDRIRTRAERARDFGRGPVVSIFLRIGVRDLEEELFEPVEVVLRERDAEREDGVRGRAVRLFPVRRERTTRFVFRARERAETGGGEREKSERCAEQHCVVACVNRNLGERYGRSFRVRGLYSDEDGRACLGRPTYLRTRAHLRILDTQVVRHTAAVMRSCGLPAGRRYHETVVAQISLC